MRIYAYHCLLFWLWVAVSQIRMIRKLLIIMICSGYTC